MSVNRAIILGNLGAKPELKYLPSGQAVCEMRIATNEAYKDKSGNKNEKVEWHRVKVWGKTAENCAQYLDKGRTVYVEGRIETRSWDDKKTGEKRYFTEIIASNVVFIGGKGGGAKRDEAPPEDGPGPGTDDGFGTGKDDDDIPF